MAHLYKVPTNERRRIDTGRSNEPASPGSTVLSRACESCSSDRIGHCLLRVVWKSRYLFLASSQGCCDTAIRGPGVDSAIGRRGIEISASGCARRGGDWRCSVDGSPLQHEQVWRHLAAPFSDCLLHRPGDGPDDYGLGCSWTMEEKTAEE